MNKKQIGIIMAVIVVVVYVTVYSSPNSQGGTGDNATEPAEYTADPVLRLYIWENYWETDTEQARREVEMELGVTYETGRLHHIHDIHQGGDKYVTVCSQNYADKMFPYVYTGCLGALYDGKMHAQTSVVFSDLPSIFRMESPSSYWPQDTNVNYYTVSGDDSILVMTHTWHSGHEEVYRRERGSSEQVYGFTFETEYLDEVYGSVPITLNAVNRVVCTTYTTVRAMSEYDPDFAVAEAVAEWRYYTSWQGADLLELLEAGVPMKETSNRQEITLIQYTQLEDLAEALS